MLQNIESVLYEIKNTLLDSEDLRKLLFYDTPNALSRSVPLISEVEDYIKIKPIIILNENSNNDGITSFISIGMIEGENFDNSAEFSFKVTIASNRRIWELDNNRIRTLAAARLIEERLHEKKFASAGKLLLVIVKEIYFNSEIIGYMMMFDLRDETGETVNEF